MSILELQNVSVGFGPFSQRTEVLTHVDLAVAANEFVAIIGFSGSGKSTLISLLAGLVSPDSGEVLFQGVPQCGPGPERGIVFQNYSLLPWLTCYGNVELAVKQVFPEMPRDARKEYILNSLKLVGLGNAQWKRPAELSGGMRQRLALARTLSIQPTLLLLDEPLSALDALTRSVLQDEIVRLWEEDKRTVVMITNDVDEAILMADRIIALTPGPGATLDRQFKVELERPRKAAELNFNPDFKRLRNEVTNYLVGLNKEAKALRASQLGTPPSLLPLDLSVA